MSQYVVLDNYFSPYQAHLDKNFLESAGVECALLNELSTQVYNFHTPGDGGIILKVKTEQLDLAHRLLSADKTDFELDENFEVGEEEAEVKCDNGSTAELNNKKSSNTWILLLIGLGILISIAALAGGFLFG